MLFAEKEPWFQLVEAKSTRKVFGAGESILLQGQAAQLVGLVLSGRAKAVAYSHTGEQTWLGFFEAGDFFGHVSLLSQNAVNYEITAESDMSILLIPASTMDDLLAHETNLSRVIAADLAKRLEQMMQRLIEAFTLSARGRICAELARLAVPIGVTPDQHIIRPNPIFVELALRVNSTRETVSRTVSDLQKKGVVSRAPGALIIENPGQLKAAVAK